jgi:hypothetical protein
VANRLIVVPGASCAVVAVGRRDPADAVVPGWAYSIGLWHSFGVPEVCVFGVPVDRAAATVNVAGESIRDGARLEPGSERSDVLNGYDVAIRSVHYGWYKNMFGQAIDFYRRPPFPLVQIIWPDRDRRWPWEGRRGRVPRRSRRA